MNHNSVPQNIQNYHWTGSIVFLQEKKIRYFDSYHSDNLIILEKIFEQLNFEHLQNLGSELVRSDWELTCSVDHATQKNAYDCEVFTLVLAEMVSRRCLNFDFTQDQMSNYRKKIGYEIINGALLDEKLCADY